MKRRVKNVAHGRRAAVWPLRFLRFEAAPPCNPVGMIYETKAQREYAEWQRDLEELGRELKAARVDLDAAKLKQERERLAVIAEKMSSVLEASKKSIRRYA